MAYSHKKRFVAGAVCPRCSAMDKLMVYRENDIDYRECVECGFKEEMKLNVATSELQTRVNQKEEGTHEVVAIRLVDSVAEKSAETKK